MREALTKRARLPVGVADQPVGLIFTKDQAANHPGGFASTTARGLIHSTGAGVPSARCLSVTLARLSARFVAAIRTRPEKTAHGHSAAVTPMISTGRVPELATADTNQLVEIYPLTLKNWPRRTGNDGLRDNEYSRAAGDQIRLRYAGQTA